MSATQRDPVHHGKPHRDWPCQVEVILLAGGTGRRMRGEDKLLREIDDLPLLRRSAQVALSAAPARLHIVVPPDNPKRQAVLHALDINIVVSTDTAQGMALSLRAGLAAVSDAADGVIVALADMPDIEAVHYQRLMSAFADSEGQKICRAASENGIPGHPVLFPRRCFSQLMTLTGDKGAKPVLEAESDMVELVTTPGNGALVDLDTPEAWDAWLKSRQ